MLKKTILLLMLLASPATFAGIWAPTNDDSNFLSLGFLFGSSSNDTFAIFDDTDTALSNPIVQFGNAATISFTQLGNGNGWAVDTGTETGNLEGSSNFQIGWSTGSGWSTEAGAQMLAANSYALGFFNNANMRLLLAFDIAPSAMDSVDPSEVPLPASIWLMTSALATLLYSGRRRSAV